MSQEANDNNNNNNSSNNNINNDVYWDPNSVSYIFQQQQQQPQQQQQQPQQQQPQQQQQHRAIHMPRRLSDTTDMLSLLGTEQNNNTTNNNNRSHINYITNNNSNNNINNSEVNSTNNTNFISSNTNMAINNNINNNNNSNLFLMESLQHQQQQYYQQQHRQHQQQLYHHQNPQHQQQLPQLYHHQQENHPYPQQPQPDLILPTNIPVRIDRSNSESTTTTTVPPLPQIREPGELLPPEYIPTDIDVCSGRGKQHWTHNGNAAFRDIIQYTTPAYMAANTKAEKTIIVNNIVTDMRTLHCQFLKRDPTSQRWFDIGDVQAREKVGHSLRDQVSAYNRTLITGAPPLFDTAPPFTLERIVTEFNHPNHGDVGDPASFSPSPLNHHHHIRRSSLALSDSGNEADERRMSLETTMIHGSFARRPSWVATTGSHIHCDMTDGNEHDTDLMRCSGIDHNHIDTEQQQQQHQEEEQHQQSQELTLGEFDDVVGEMPRLMIPPTSAKISVQHAQRRRSSLEHLETFDFYIDTSNIDHSAGFRGSGRNYHSNNYNNSVVASWSMSQTFDAISSAQIPNATSTEEHGADIHFSPYSDPTVDHVVDPRYSSLAKRPSMTIEDVWNRRLSVGQMDQMLQSGVQNWDPIHFLNNSVSGGNVIPVRRAVMAGGTTLRRMTNSLRISGMTLESIMDFGESFQSVFDLDHQQPTVVIEHHTIFEAEG